MINNPIGTLKRIRRYPVKSMAGEDVKAVYVHETGLNGDRVYAFYDHNSKRTSLPYLTGREKRSMLLMQPQILNEPDPEKPYPENYRPEVVVSLPGKKGAYNVTGREVSDHIRSLMPSNSVSITLDYSKAGIFDSKPISMLGMKTVDLLANEIGIDMLDPLRFRENFYIDWESDKPFFEDGLVGKSLRLGGELLLHVVKKNERCVMICIDPDTGDYDKRVLGNVAKNHDTNTGVYSVVRKPGAVRVGDPVVVC